MTNTIVSNSAVLSPCEEYRYTLSRMWSSRSENLIFVLCNPSTADSFKDDPTVRRLISFTKAWGFGGFTVLNLLAYRATNPKELGKVKDAYGPRNLYYWEQNITKGKKVIAAWGSSPPAHSHAHSIKWLMRSKADVYVFGFTMHGRPKHPLYLSKDTIPYSMWCNSKFLI